MTLEYRPGSMETVPMTGPEDATAAAEQHTPTEEPAISKTLYAATERIEQGAPELRAISDSIADVLAPLAELTDAATLQIDEPDATALLTDQEAQRLGTLLTDAADQANTLATVLADAADEAGGLAAVLADGAEGDSLNDNEPTY
jgi:hypothetical protein